MAKIVGGFASSHSPLMSLTGELWAVHAQNDLRNRELVQPPNGRRVTYDELLADADPGIAEVSNVETFTDRVANIQKGLDDLQTRFANVNPDIVVMFGDDQSEFFFDDNMPSINVYWGDTIKVLPRTVTPDMSEARRMSSLAYGTREYDHPVPSDLGLHVIESLMDQDFDVSHSRYVKESYGGTIGPATWYPRPLANNPAAALRPAARLRLRSGTLVRRQDAPHPPHLHQHLLPTQLDQPAPRLRARPRRPQGHRGMGHRQDRGLRLHRRPQPLRRGRGA